ncbi:MAG: thiolase family protein [Pseudomonadota bacterium]|uniref:thiolase family protein n=2 Tax=Roseovarius TaxID=74030 RepID=UPI0022A8C98D|nr:acetyl-CoA C-acyltransferase [Roseovarius sp. EGI FJ00037]MCZ0813075.1 acetyl-CoA C-acyltransferase [Roseovarius sp. EGI FJ00037]
MKISDIVLCHPVRTPIGKFGGSLKDITAPDLGARIIRDVLRRSDVAPDKVSSVVFGNVIQAGTGMNPARQAMLNGGLPESVPAMTVNRVCGSGAEAIAAAARLVLLGEADCVVAGGMENMDQAPHLLDRARWGYRMGPGTIDDAMLRDGLNDAFSGKHSGWHTEDLVSERKIPRETQDAWAARSHQRFSKAQEAGHFAAEILPIEIKSKSGGPELKADESNRPDATAEGLAKLRPAFREDGTITAGNAPGLNSGAAAMIVTTARFAAEHGLDVAARLVASGVGAVAPGMFGLGPVPAVHQALDRAGWSAGDVERAEINEAFAAIAIALTDELDLPEDIVNVEGGVIAHGHPIGATGAVLTTRLLHSMARDDIRRGLVTLCIGGGQGIALLLERAD